MSATKTKPKTNEQLALDFAASFTASTASTTTALTALAVTSTATWVDAPWWFVAGAGGALSLGAWAVSRAHSALNRPHAVPQALAGSWAAWTAVAAAAVGSNPYTWTPLHFWGAAAAFVTVWVLTWWALDRADIIDEAHFAENLENYGKDDKDAIKLLEGLLEDRDRATLANRWVKEITDVLKFTPEVTGLSHWKPVGGVSPGFTMQLNLPKGASAAQFSDTALAQIAQDVEHVDPATGEMTRGLPNGCSITTAKGGRQGQILLHVPTINPDELVVDHPADWTPLTINGPIPLSFTPHGQDIVARMREFGAMIVGPPGTGKSTFLSNMLSSFARCNDVLVWGVDISKGRDGVFGHWVNDLPAGSKPLVTRIATNKAQAIDLAEAGLREAAARLKKYRQWMKEHNTDLVPISPECPMLYLVFDESAEIFSAEGRDPQRDKLRATVIELMRTTRQAGIRTVFTFVDMNLASVGVSDLLKFSNIKIVLTGDGASSNTDAVIRFWGRPRGMDVDQLIAKGIGVGQFGRGPEVHRGPRMLPDLIEKCTVATSPNRPPADLVATEWVGDDATTVTVAETSDVEWTLTQPEPEAPTDPKLAAEFNEIVNHMDDDQIDQLDQPTQDPEPRKEDPTGLAWLAEATADLDLGPLPTTPEEEDHGIPANVTGWRKVVLTHLAKHPDFSFGTGELVDILQDTYGQSIARQTLATQLSTWAKDGTITGEGEGAYRAYRANRPQDGDNPQD